MIRCPRCRRALGRSAPGIPGIGSPPYVEVRINGRVDLRVTDGIINCPSSECTDAGRGKPVRMCIVQGRPHVLS